VTPDDLPYVPGIFSAPVTLSPDDLTAMRERAESHSNAWTNALARDVLVLLDALAEAEADHAIKDRAMTDYFVDASRRAEAAEAENARMKKLLYEDDGLNGVVPQLWRAEEERDRLREALVEYADHQSWRCGHPDRYSQDPDCRCGLVQTWRDLGFQIEYDDDGRAALAGGDTA
jgi:hypothetical protein